MAQTTLHEYLQQTEQAISSGRLDDALTHCQRVLNQFPEALKAQHLLGRVYMAQDYLEEAQQTFDWVLTNDPESVPAYCDRAALSERMSDVDTALDCYQQAYELSRGDGQIRREFNQLSTRAGQAGFMFSRAGLARLYMRGDLLAEAIQEWEAVLASSPDRLDARLGLMETCWHEGKHERAEQLARQVLQDVPGCLKALMLLAFFVAAKDMQEAHQYIQKAKALDPELLIAQELFKDTQASQPDHPFLQFLNTGPIFITIDEAESVKSAVAVASSSNGMSGSNGAVSTHDAQVAVNTLPQWGDMDNWNGIDTLDKPLIQTPAETSNHVNGTQNGILHDVEQNAQSAPAPTQNYTFDAPDSTASWEQATNDGASFSSNSWSASVEDKQAPAPPSWLNMLTQNEPQQTSETLAKAPEKDEEIAGTVEQYMIATPDEKEERYQPVKNDSSQESLVTSADEEDEEASFFGPEWLKSLGAASFDVDTPSQKMPAVSPLSSAPAASLPAASLPVEAEAAVAPQAAFDLWQTSPAQPEASSEPWLSSFQQSTPYEPSELRQSEPTIERPVSVSSAPEAVAIPGPNAEAVTPEQSLLTTLEGLETDLRSQGFVPLEPNSLSTIAQDQQEAPTASSAQAALPLEYAQPVQSTQGEEQQEEMPTLSSALAELGSLEPPVAATGEVPASSPQQYQQTDYAAPQADEPSWLASFRMTPAPRVAQEPPVTRRTTMPLQPAASMQNTDSQAETTLGQKEEPQSPNTSVRANPVAAPAPVQPTRIDALPGPIFTPTYEPAIGSKKLPEPVKVSAARTDVGFDSDLELETTMKRPAIHLQTMQAQRNTAPASDQASFVNKARSGERPAIGRVSANDTTISYRDRLVKGYQHQLVGDYDEAMQEYRILIRNAPELLSEVVSNLRALLKLAPKYPAGYRVLGDAYMRQGEYLQAMEAYNKALTMAKKAKG